MTATIGAGVRYESNVFRDASTGDPVSDYGLEISPSINVHEDSENLTYDVGYRLTFVRFKQQPAVDDVNHHLNGSFLYTITPKLTLEGTEQFLYTTNLINQFVPDNPDTAINESGTIGQRRKDKRNLAQLALRYALSNRVRATLATAYDFYDPDGINLIGNNTLSLSGDLSYRMDRADTLGAGVQTTFQFFEQVVGVPASRSDIYEIFGTYLRKFGEETTLSFRGGPTFIRSTQQSPSATSQGLVFPFVLVNGVPNYPDASVATSACSTGTPFPVGPSPVVRVFESRNCDFVPGNFFPADNTQTLSFGPLQTPPPPLSSDQLTFFVTASLAHRWTENLNSLASYRRSQSDSFGQGGTSIRDRVTFVTSWRVSPVWEFALRGNWIRRESAVTLNQTFAVQTRSCTPTSGPNGIDFVDCPTDPPPANTIPLVRFTGQLVSQPSDRVNNSRTWSVDLLTQRRLTNRLSALASYQWVLGGNLNSSTASATNHRVDVGFTYRFGPVRLWN